MQGNSQQFEVVASNEKHWKGARYLSCRSSGDGMRAFIYNVNKSRKKDCHNTFIIPIASGNTLVKLGQSVCKTPEEFKAWSQNLGHEKVLTTFFSYGEVGNERQRTSYRTLQYRDAPRKPTSMTWSRQSLRNFREWRRRSRSWGIL